MKANAPRTSLCSCIEDLARHGDRPAFERVTAYRKWSKTYREVYGDALRIASLLRERGLSKGDRMLLWAPNSPEWITFFFGAVLRGVVVVPVDSGSTPGFVSAVARRVGPKLLVRAAEGGPAAPRVPSIAVEDAESLLSGLPECAERVALDAEDTLEIVFTSGTTATPRGVVLKHGNLLANLAPVEAGYRERERLVRPFLPLRFLSLIPLSHMFGQLLAAFVSPLLGCTTVFTTSLSASAVARTLKEERIWVLFAVPRFLRSLEDTVRGQLEKRGRSASFDARYGAAASARPWRRIWMFRDVHAMLGRRFWAFVAGGAHLEPGVIEFWRRLGYAVVQGYGLTETAPVITVNNPFGPSADSVGHPIGDQEIRIAPDGEILVRGRNVMAGYFNDEAATAASFEDGWFKTGDIGEMDEAGQLHIRGRKKDVIVTDEGLNVFPEDIEARLNAHPAVRDSAVIGRREGARILIHALLVLQEEGADPSAVVGEVNGGLEPHQKIRGFSLWRDGIFPRTPTLKLKRGEIARQAEAAAGTAVESETDRLGRLVATLSSGEPGDAGSEARLENDLGLSSLDRVELACALEEQFQVEINEDRITGETSIGDLRTLVRAGAAREGGLPFPSWPRAWPCSWLRFAVLHGIAFPLLRIWCRVAVRFGERLGPVSSPVLFVANHVSDLDTAVILRALPVRLRIRLAPAMTTEHFRAWLEGGGHAAGVRLRAGMGLYLLFLFGNAYLLPPTGGFRQTLRNTGRLIGEGFCPLVFPEGERTGTGRMAGFRAGIGMMVREMGVPVVPVHLEGLYGILPRTARFPKKRGTVTVSFGEPLTFGREDNEKIAERLRLAVADLACGETDRPAVPENRGRG